MIRNVDSFETYMRDISAFPRITPEREQELSVIIQAPGIDEAVKEAAAQELVQSNLRLVVHCLKEFDQHLNSATARLSNPDLIAEGNIGLMKAAHSFQAEFGDGNKPVRFSTYACKCIKSHMIRAIKKSRFIHIPEHHFTYWAEIESVRKAADGDISDDAIRQQLNISEEAFTLFKQSADSRICHLEDFGSQNEDASHWAEYIADESAATPFDEIEHEDLRQYLFDAIDKLPKRTGKMLSMLYFNENTPTLKDLSILFGISSERCRQICAHGIKMLRRNLLTQRGVIADNLEIAIGSAA
jgi:RNA polymerase sigma-32 factor